MQTILTGALMAFFVLSTPEAAPTLPKPEVLSEIPLVEELFHSRSVSLTGYNAVPEQTDSDPFTTASGAYSNPELIAARSVDLKEELPFGTVIEFVIPEGKSTPPCGLSSVEHLVGLRVVADSMHPRKRNQIDILFDKGDKVQIGKKKVNPAVVLGVCEDIKIRVVGKIEIKDMPKNQTELLAMLGGASLAVNK